jgi:hypothetical protein
MAPPLLAEIQVPFLRTRVGCIPHREVPEGNVERLRGFLDAALERPNVRIAIRNDGSRLSFQREIGAHYLDAIPEVLDNGFFFDPVARIDTGAYGEDYVCINLTVDQIRMRSEYRGEIDEPRYLAQLRDFVEFAANELGLRVVFVPHIYSDIFAISRLLETLDAFLLRTRVVVAPHLQDDAGAHHLFAIYKSARMVVGTRFHANVCSLAMGRPTVGLMALDRVKHMFDSVGFPESYVPLDEGFSDKLKDRLLASVEADKDYTARDHAREDTRRTYRGLFEALELC